MTPEIREQLKGIMKGEIKSRRHDLFLVKKEREGCSGSGLSLLHQLSNPGYLGAGDEKDTAVITYLRDKVFKDYFQEADPKLRELGIGSAFLYASCVLFPETYIHQHQAKERRQKRPS